MPNAGMDFLFLLTESCVVLAPLVFATYI